MIKLNRILVPTDFSEFSQPAMNYGCAIAARFESELHLIHIVPDPAMLIPEAGAFSVDAIESQSGELARRATTQLNDMPGSGWENGRPIQREVRIGTIHLEIIDYAKSNDIDLIVIGTHGRSGLMHILMGSVAERIVRHSACPVLTVKPAGHQFVTE